MDMEDEEVVKHRRSVADVGQKNQFDSLQGEARRNKETIIGLRRENKELRLVLQQTVRGQRSTNTAEHYNKQEEMIHNRMCVLKRSINAVRAKNAELAAEIEKTKELNAFVMKESGGAVDEGSMLAQKIRALENRLDKCLIKHNEVSAIRKTYETLLERLQLEQSGFDVQLNATEKELVGTQKVLDDLTDVGEQAAVDRDASRAEVIHLKDVLGEERRAQRSEMVQRRKFVEDKRDLLEKKHRALNQRIAQQAERHHKLLLGVSSHNTFKKRTARSTNSFVALRPEEVERLQQQKACYLHLREATHSHNVSEVIRKIVERLESNQQLEADVARLISTVEERTATKLELQTTWNEVNHRAGGALVRAKVTRSARDNWIQKTSGAGIEDSGAEAEDYADYRLLGDRTHANRNIVTEFEEHLKQRHDELSEAQSRHKKLSQLLHEVETGVQNLAEKLSVVRVDAGPVVALGHNSKQPQNRLTAKSQTADTHDMASEEIQSYASVSSAVTAELLRSCDAKLRHMLEELSLESVVLAASALEHHNSVSPINPQTNVRLPKLTAAAAPSQLALEDSEEPDASAAATRAAAKLTKHGMNMTGSSPQMLDDFPDNEIHDREELKHLAMATVEREEKKARKMLTQRRKEESM